MRFATSGLPDIGNLRQHWEKSLQSFEQKFSTEKKARRAFVTGPLAVARFVNNLPLSQEDRLYALKLALHMPITGRFETEFSEQYLAGVAKGDRLDPIESLVLKAGAIVCLNLMQNKFYRDKPMEQRARNFQNILNAIRPYPECQVLEVDTVLEDLIERQRDLQYFDSLPETNRLRRKGLSRNRQSGSMPV